MTDNQTPFGGDSGTVLGKSLVEEMQTSYMDYAMSVIVARALPDVRDGLKPVQRRILYAMQQAGATAASRHRKCAAFVGDVMKLYHPHSDSAIYDSLVRMGQGWAMRYPLIDGQGNFGSIDGDPPAAMRYTEARLAAVAGEMLADIEKDTVPFVENYDGTEQQPVILPARIPNLLVNGATGIAVGMTTNIPPHNLREVAAAVQHLIEHPEATIDELMRFLPGPDFPTGGMIMGRAGIRQAYATGHGRIVVRARHTFEEAPNGRERIIIDELPYAVNKANLVAKIADLVADRKLEGIADLRDESDRHGMRIVIELRREARPFTVLNNLYKHTALQQTFGVTALAIVDWKPQILSLKELLQHFIDHRREVIVRRTRFDLARAQDRAHILEGLKIALDHLDEVIATIRGASDPDDANTQLQSKFGLSDRQSRAILQLTLSRLTRLERGKIDQEYEEVIKLIAYLESILASDRMVLNLISEDMTQTARRYGDERRTEISDQDPTDLTAEDLIPKEEVVVTLTHRGYVKRQVSRSFRAQQRGGVGVKGARPTAGSDAPSGTREEDYAEHLRATHTHASMLFFTQSGRVFQLRVHEIPERDRASRGVPINNLIEIAPNEHITAIFVRPEADDPSARYMMMATRR
ncbi:MAG: DNA gyrase subunit A, partial [Candidatus Dormibacteraeota bacterium]|nr:DNA gyrase subunit A [Candidatus Dormibacteraeota bacterium]